MSLILSSPVAPQAATAPATSQAGRNDSQSQSDSDSFGAVLERSQASPTTTPKKTAERHQARDKSDNEKTESPDPAAALALALIALEPRLAAGPASAAPSGPASAVAAAVETDTGLSVAPGELTTLSQNAQEQLVSPLALAAPEHELASALTAPAQQDGDSPLLLANAATIGSTGAATETSESLNTAQIALAAPLRNEAAGAVLKAKDTAADAGSTNIRDAGKIAEQAMMPDTRSTGQQTTPDDAATDDRGNKYSAKPELRSAAPIAASTADAATAIAARGNAVAADQFDLDTATPANPANVVLTPPPAVTATTAQHAAAAPTSLPLTPPIGSSDWGNALGKQMVWMGNANHQVAELQLNPAGLGPLKVTLTINNHQAEALFVSAHPAVRAAVEAALPQLRTNLADNGISLGNTSVSADTPQQSAFAQDQANQSSQAQYRAGSVNLPSQAAELGLPGVAAAITSSSNMVDTFA